MVLSDRVYVMHKGRLVQGGSPKDLYERPNSLFVAEFIGNTNTLKLRDIDRAGGHVRLETGEAIRVASLPDAPRATVLIIRPQQVCLAPNRAAENVLDSQVSTGIFIGNRIVWVGVPQQSAAYTPDHPGP